MCRQTLPQILLPKSRTRGNSGLLISSLLRLAHRSDCLDKKLYPLLTHKHRFSTQKCSVCHLFIGRYVCKSKRTNTSGGFKMNDSTIVFCFCFFLTPRWFTTGDRFAPSDPCLFCDKCFRMLHYDTEGKKLGEFQAFPFVDRGAFNWHSSGNSSLLFVSQRNSCKLIFSWYPGWNLDFVRFHTFLFLFFYLQCSEANWRSIKLLNSAWEPPDQSWRWDTAVCMNYFIIRSWIRTTGQKYSYLQPF